MFRMREHLPVRHVNRLHAGDFVVTRDNLRGGSQTEPCRTEPFRSRFARLAVNFASENLGMVGLGFSFTRLHHKMERAVSMVNIGGRQAQSGLGWLIDRSDS